MMHEIISGLLGPAIAEWFGRKGYFLSFLIGFFLLPVMAVMKFYWSFGWAAGNLAIRKTITSSELNSLSFFFINCILGLIAVFLTYVAKIQSHNKKG